MAQLLPVLGFVNFLAALAAVTYTEVTTQCSMVIQFVLLGIKSTAYLLPVMRQ
jgi:hypothetical protein